MHRRGKIRKRTLGVEAPAETEMRVGQDIAAPLPIGTVTSKAGPQALALVRVDRLLSAEQAGEPPHIDESPVTITKPGWLMAELATQDQA